MTISQRDAQHIFNCLRSGLVPERGLDAFAVGVERPRAEIGRLLDLGADGEGVFKFLRGGYGCGKTFMARLAVLDAQARGFATSFVVVSDNDLHFYRFDELYRKVVGELGTSACPRGALGDVIDRWIAHVEKALLAGGAEEGAPDFDERVQRRLGEDIVSMTRGAAPEDLGRVLRAVFACKQAGKIAEAGALLSWLSGSTNVAQSAKKVAEVKGDIGSGDAMAYLHGTLEIVKAAGYKGLLIVIDEAETILRMRQDVRGKSLNAIRQIIDAAKDYPGLFWVFTGTPAFFDDRRGVAGLPPLHERIQFLEQNGRSSLRQAQLKLEPFDTTRLTDVALKLRELFPIDDRARLEQKVSAAFIQRLVEEVSTGFRGDVGVVPRQFLRRFVEVLDRVDEDPSYDPMSEHGFSPRELNESEQRLAAGDPPYDPEPEDDKGYKAAALEF
jgi:hypothetical protein